MTEHAKFSPSGAHRWMRCAGSLVLEAPYSDESSEFADEGTAAHELASMAFTSGMRAEDFIGTEIAVGERSFAVDDEMAGYVQAYLDNCDREPGEHHCEIRVPLSAVLDVPEQFGTADRVILNAEEGLLVVRDLKFGRGVRVDAQKNEQLMLYAAGAAIEFEAKGKWKRFKVCIDQPRLDHVDEYEFTRDELVEFIKEARKAVKTATAASLAPPEALRETYLTPGPKQCQWCKAKGACPAYAEQAQATALADFDVVEETPKPLVAAMSDEEIAAAYAKVDWVKAWVEAVSDEAFRRAMSGQELPGLKLVQGRAGARRWSDEEQAEIVLKRARLKADEMYNKKLISPTQAEKILKDKPRVWHKAAKLVTQSEGKLHLAPADDKRPAQAPTSTDDFEDVS